MVMTINEFSYPIPVSRIEYYLRIADAVASESKCSRRKFGAVLVKDDEIISTGYNGSIRGSYNCGEEIKCLKDLFKEEPYTSYVNCPAIHAEVNACLSAGRRLSNGASLFLGIGKEGTKTGLAVTPCQNCRRVLAQVGIKYVYFLGPGGIVCEDVRDYVVMENTWMNNRLEEGKDS